MIKFYAGEAILGTPERGQQGAVPPKTPILAVFGDFLMKGAKMVPNRARH